MSKMKPKTKRLLIVCGTIVLVSIVAGATYTGTLAEIFKYAADVFGGK